MMIKSVIAWSGGQVSTALIGLMLMDKLQYHDAVVVFLDTGTERPESYRYIKRVVKELKKKGIDYKYISPFFDKELYTPKIREKTVYEYFTEKGSIPPFRGRWCCYMWKSIPLSRYMRRFKLSVCVSGLCKGEERRMTGAVLYPLRWYSREDCIKIIKDAGLPTPPRSGCWMCPMQSKRGLIELHYRNPDLWRKCVRLERKAVEKRGSPTYWREGTLEEKMKKWLAQEKGKRRK